MKQPILAAKKITKSYPGVRALKDADLFLQEGEVLALLGENGAGKSTLMKILAGIQRADRGELLVQGEARYFADVTAAMSCGIALIHQELNLADNLDVAANVFLGREPRRYGFVMREEMRLRAQVLLDRLGFGLPADTMLAGLSPGKKQLVEIAKALATNARILIMDEPTASLSQSECEKLFQVIHRLRDEGVSVIYISHRLPEIARVADRVMVLRDGENVGELSREEITHDAMVRLMVGREMSEFFQHKTRERGEKVFVADHLRTQQHSGHELSLQLHAGEIVGLAGLVGAGRSELLRAMAGMDAVVSADMSLDGKKYAPTSSHDAIERGVVLVPEDRKEHGLLLDFSVKDNIALASLIKLSRWGLWRNNRAENQLAEEQIKDLQIKASQPTQRAGQLSGGNQQKIVIGKWLATAPRLLLLDEPTRGIDVGAKREIYHIMEDLAAQGKCVFFASSDLEEILTLADRVYVMHEGKIMGEISRQDLTEESIMQWATGMK